MKQPRPNRQAVGNLTRRSLFRSLGVASLTQPGFLLSAAPLWDPQPASETIRRLEKINPKHPSLHFTSDELGLLRNNAVGTHLRYAELLYRWLEEHSDWSPPQMDGGAGAEVALEESGAFLTNAALAWVISENEQYLELARRWSLSVCEQDIESIRSYGRGVLAAGLARSYDWLYQDLEGADREVIRSKLESILTGLYQAALPANQGAEWWADVRLHHDHWIPAGGLGEAALALLGEVDGAPEWAAWAKADFESIFPWLGDDGAWHEGVADWVYAMAPLLWFFSAWKSVTNEDPHDIPWIRNTSQYRLYHWLPDNTYVYLDDSFRSGRYNTSGSASCHLLRRLAGLFQDKQTQWLAERDEIFDLDPEARGVFRAPFENFSFVQEPVEYRERSSQCLAWNLLWYDAQLPAISPKERATSKHFDNQEIAILRTGWDKTAAVVSLSCGPLAGRRAAEHIRAGNRLDQGNSHHAHADYGSFTLFACGQYFVVPPGYARRGSRFQNVVAVNGSDFLTSQDLELRILGTESDPFHSYVAADATNAFPGGLGIASYRRHLVLLHEGLLIVFDDLVMTSTQTSASYNRFEWTVHTDPATHRLQLLGKKIRWLNQDGVPTPLNMDLLYPEGFAWEQRVMESTNGQPLLTALTLVRPEWYETAMRVLSVFSWIDGPSNPKAIRGKGVWGVTWDEAPMRPAIVFAPSTDQASDLRGIVNGKQDVLLFGMQSAPDCVRL